MKCEIGSIAKISGGQIVGRVEAKRDNDKVIGSVKLLIPKAMANGTVIHDNLSEIYIKTELDEKRITKAGDIILKLSQPYDATYITEKDENLLVTSFCLILREIDTKVNPLYLLSLLNSDIYKEQALNSTTGATVPILTKGNVEKMSFDILSTSEQNRIVEFSKSIVKKEKLFTEVISLEKMKLSNMLKGEF